MRVPGDCRELRLRYETTCRICSIVQSSGTRAFWSPSARAVFCTACTRGAELALATAGIPGAGAAREHARRAARDAERQRRRWGRLAPLASRLAGANPSTQAWAVGAAGEERLAAFLERELAGEAIFLHDRRLPDSRANIDHIAVGPAGVWVIDAKRYRGRVERRNAGGLLRTDVRLFVGGRDRTNLVGKLARQVEAVRARLAPVPAFADVPVRAAVCFTNSDWGFLNLGRPFFIDGVLVTYPGALRSTLREPPVLDRDAIGRIAARLALELSPA